MFCPTCGKPLPERTELLDEITALKNEPLSYRLLRFLRGFLTIIGIVLALLAIFLIPVVSTDVYRALSASQLAPVSAEGINAPRTISFWFTLLFCSATFFSGVAWIVVAQIVGILVATYDRSRETSRLMRRLALMLSNKEGS